VENNDDFWKENDYNFYNEKEFDSPERNEQNRETEVDSSFQRHKTFSEKELEEKRLWILKMKKSLNNNINDFLQGKPTEDNKTINIGNISS